MTSALLIRGTGALAWLAYLWQLSRMLPADALAPTLFSLAVASLIAGLASAGHAPLILRSGASNPDSLPAQMGHALGPVAAGALCCGMILGLVSWLGIGSLSPWQAVWTAISAVLLALSAVLAAAQRALGGYRRALVATGPMRALLPAAMVLLADRAEWFAQENLLGWHASGVLLSVLLLCPGLPRPRCDGVRHIKPGALWQAQAGWQLLTQLDVLVAGALLKGEAAVAYFLARRVAGFMPMALDAMRVPLAPRLARAFAKGRAGAAMAVINRHFFRTGAPIALLIAALSPLLLSILDRQLVALSGPAALLLVAGYAAPVWLGAGGMALTMGGLDATRRRHILCLLPCAAVLLPLTSIAGPATLALGAGLVHIALAALDRHALQNQLQTGQTPARRTSAQGVLSKMAMSVAAPSPRK